MHVDLLATVDVVNFCFQDNRLKVVLWKRKNEPYKDQWALPGAIINGTTKDKSMEATVERVLKDRLKLQISHMEQVGSVGNDTRDERGWSISTVYMTMTTMPIESNDEIAVFDYNEIANRGIELPFDHNDLVVMVYERLASKATYTSLPIKMLPANAFTINSLIDLYKEIIPTGVKGITIRKRIEFLEKKGHVAEVGLMKKEKGRPSKVYSHDRQVHDFDRCIIVP